METELIDSEFTFQLELIRASDDSPLQSDDYQTEIGNFTQSLKRLENVKVSVVMFAQDAVGGEGFELGEYIIKTAIPFGSIASILVTWIKGHYGRKVRLEIKSGNKIIKAEAQTVDEIKELVEIAEECQKKSKH